MSTTEATIVPTGEDLVRILSGKAAKDAAFRGELLADPRAAFEKTFGTKLPENVKLQALEQATGTWIIPVPPPADRELSDNELESVAGGSKSGATSFFNTVGNGFKSAGSHVGGYFGNMHTEKNPQSPNYGKLVTDPRDIC